MNNNTTALTVNPSLTMSSLEIAELTGKEHKNVLRDIGNMLDELGQLKSERTSYYFDVQNKQRPCYNLDEELSLTLVSGYNIKMRHAIIKRWKELESQSGLGLIPVVEYLYLIIYTVRIHQKYILNELEPLKSYLSPFQQETEPTQSHRNTSLHTTNA